MPKRDDIWQHWTDVVTDAGAKTRVKCNYCPNEQLKNAVKCKRHLIKCQFGNKCIVDKFAEELRHKMDRCRTRLVAMGCDNDNDDSYETLADIADQRQFQLMATDTDGQSLYQQLVANTSDMTYDQTVGDDNNCIAVAVTDVSAIDGVPTIIQIGGTPIVTPGLPVRTLINTKISSAGASSIWNHWTDIVDSEGKRRVRCNYCPNVQLKNASKCRRHIMRCLASNLMAKRRLLNDQSLPMFTDLLNSGAAGSGGGDENAVKLGANDSQASLRAQNGRLASDLRRSEQTRALLEAQRNYLLKTINECSNCGHDSALRQRLAEFEVNLRRLKCNRLDTKWQSIWSHWTDVTDSVVISGKGQHVFGQRVRCRHCGNVQRKNAVKCRRHVANCRPCDETIRNYFAKEIRLKSVVRRGVVSEWPPKTTNTSRTTDADGDDNSLDGDLQRIANYRINIDAGTAGDTSDGRRVAKRYACDACEYVTDNPQRIQSHTNRQHLNVRPYPCDVCDKQFLTKAILTLHKKNIHAPPEDIVYYRCDWSDCQFQTRYQSSLTIHKLQHLGVKQFPCQWPGCPLGFYTGKDLRKHELSHSRTYRCEWVGCGAVLKSSANLKRHKLIHTTDGSKPHACCWPGCDKRFQFGSFLTTHMRRHRGDRPHQCPHEGCDRRFYDKSKMLNHCRTHGQQRDYPCVWPGCDASYKTSNHLERHVLSHTSPDAAPEPTVFACHYPDCGKQFGHKRNLNTHIRYHRSEAVHECDWPDCGRRFKSRDVLRQHLMSHRGERPHVCPYEGCGRAFIRRTLMTAHHRTHESAPAFVCELLAANTGATAAVDDDDDDNSAGDKPCGKQFWTNACLRRHQRQVHQSSADNLVTHTPINESSIGGDDITADDTQLADNSAQIGD